MTNRTEHTLKSRPAWRRWVGVFACLAALAVALLGHIEALEAVPSAGNTAVVMADVADGGADQQLGTTPQHCMHQSQCTVQAVLPATQAFDTQGVNRSIVSAIRPAVSRSVSPTYHPPKISALL